MPEPRPQTINGSQDLTRQAVHSHVGIKIQLASTGKDIGSGRIQTLNSDQDFGQQPVHGVGDYMPSEIVPTRFAGTLSLNAFRIRLKDLVDLGLAALGADILKLGVINIVMFDKHDSQVYRVYENCYCSRYSERVQEGAIAGEDATFLYTNVRRSAASV